MEDTISSDEVLRHQLDQLSAEKSQLEERLEEQLQSEKKVADDLKVELDQLANQNEALVAEKAKLLEDSISCDAIRDELNRLTSDNADLDRQLAESRELLDEYGDLQSKLRDMESALSENSHDLDLARQVESDYQALKTRHENLVNDHNTLTHKCDQLQQDIVSMQQTYTGEELALSQALTDLQQSQAAKDQLEDALFAKEMELASASSSAAALTAELNELKHSSETQISELTSSNKSFIQELEIQRAAFQNLTESSQQEQQQQWQQIEVLREEMVKSQQSSVDRDLTHSQEDEIKILRYQIVELQAKLEDANQELSHPGSVSDDDVS